MLTWQLAFKIIKLYEYEFKLLNKIENKTKKNRVFLRNTVNFMPIFLCMCGPSAKKLI